MEHDTSHSSKSCGWRGLHSRVLWLQRAHGFEEQLSGAQSRVDELERSVTERATDIEALRSELQSSQSYVAALEAKNSDQEAEIGALRSQLEAMRIELTTVHEQSSAALDTLRDEHQQARGTQAATALAHVEWVQWHVGASGMRPDSVEWAGMGDTMAL